ncbi:hypothetical protein CH373_05350 [Leptospira perolatii]|uniref:YHYH domain-containing protein n=1 Tax=Leptospira perolatii TaxID=2023191 RepID=A0A2M9ZQW1_9LEPT|nr:YHYH protein [Leptospira perolatii]PJZ70583.1 hypothetical protein CH360_05770 [Leptospira perolatii]PJZ74477.1 hypothetical protein CH373_05350 [Leptospira perolatii]
MVRKMEVFLICLLLGWNSGCKNLFGGNDDGPNDVEKGLAAFLLSCTSGTDVVETLYAGGPSCITNISADAPAWIRNNFHCVTVRVCGSSYWFQTNDLPPFKTAYYGASSPYYTAFDTQSGARHQNPNTISSQNISMLIPSVPSYASSNLDPTAGIDAIGISTYGVVFFNNQAAPGDVLATEYQTMDSGEGHPQNSGKYHHHTEPFNLTNDGMELIGVMLDGYPIYGKKDQSGNHPTLDSTTNSIACTTTEFPSGTYCYHVVNSTGVGAYILGSYFRGRRGTLF